MCFWPANSYEAIRLFRASYWTMKLFGENVHGKFAELKLASAERCPKPQGKTEKSEIR